MKSNFSARALCLVAAVSASISLRAQTLGFDSVNLPTDSGPTMVIPFNTAGIAFPCLAVANYGFEFKNDPWGAGGGNGTTITTYTNGGNGILYPKASIAVGLEPISLAAADINNDGWQDLICAPVGGTGLTVLTNDGGANFSFFSSVPTGKTPAFVVAADVNHDSYIDLISANYGDATLSILTNDSHGGFASSSVLQVGQGPSCLAAADFNGDGWIDLACANLLDGSMTILTNNGSGGFVASSTFGISGGIGWVVATDVNQDGQIDLVTANGATIATYLNDGKGNFTFKSAASTGFSSGTLVAADFNGDGRIDIAAPDNGNFIQGGMTVLTNDGAGNFTVNSTIVIGQASYNNYPNFVTAADFNLDGNNDIVTSCYGSQTLTVSSQNADPRPFADIVLPVNGQLYQTNDTIIIGTVAFGPNEISSVDYYVDGLHVASRTSSPYLLQVGANTIPGGSHGLQAKIVDSAGLVNWSAEVQFIVSAQSTGAQPPPSGPAPDGLLLWLDSSDAATVLTNLNGGVFSWINKAPGAGNALQYTGNNDNNTLASYNSAAPTYVNGSNGIKVVNFNGNGYLDNLDFSSATPSDLTVFVLASVNSNPGNFSAFMAFDDSPTSDDYLTGLNFDMGANSSSALNRLNVEGAKGGGGGGPQLLKDTLNFNQYYLYEIDYGGGPANSDSLVSVLVNNAPEISLQQSSALVNLNALTVGARFGQPGGYGNNFNGQIAAIMVYDHQLSSTDLAVTRAYLAGFFNQSGSTPPPTSPPAVTLLSPTNSASFTTSATFTARATARVTAKGRSIRAVNFLLDGSTLLGTVTSSPYALDVPAAQIAPGSHTIQAVAVDSAGATAIASAQITINIPGTALINFDALNASSGAVVGTPLAQYLARYGITLANVTVGSTMEAVNASGLTGAVQASPSSPPNFLTQAGLNGPVSFTLDLAKPVHAVSFTRPALSSSSGLVSHPQWTATALDTNGNEIASVSQPLILSSQSVPAQTFELTGDDIAAVRFDSDSQKTAAFSAILLDDLFLNSNPVASLLSIGVSVSDPGANGFVAPANVTITADVTNSLDAPFFVEFYSGVNPIGRVSNPPYQFTWTNVLPGTYAIRARAVSSTGLAVRSRNVTVVVQPEPNSTVIDFDSLTTSRAAIKGEPVRNYLATFGVTVTNATAGTLLTVDQAARIAGGKAVSSPSAPNIFTQTGSGPSRFTLKFATLLARFGFTRPELLANPFVSQAKWQVTALDAAGAIIAQAGEDEIDSSTNVGKAEFSLSAESGPGIASVVFTFQGSGLTTFNSVVMDNFILTTNPDGFPPAVAITRPLPGRELASPPSVQISANAFDPAGIESVVFYANGSRIGAATVSPYTIQWRRPAVGDYALTAIATGADGLSSVASVVEISIDPPAGLFGIATPPASQTVSAGALPTFSVIATGPGPFTYQWLFNGSPISGANSPTFTLGHPAEDIDAGNYSVTVTSGGQSITSPSALLQIIDPPKFAVQPLSVTVAAGANVALTPLPAGTGPFTWQWLLNGNEIPGETNRDYFIQAAQALQSGNYQVVVGNSAASTVSAVASVVVQAATVPFTNDDFANRSIFNPLLGPVSEDNSSATFQAGEPLHDGLPGGKSLWFTWRPNFSGNVSLTTEGSDFDTLLAVYTGTAVNKLKVIAADDDSGGFFTSLVTFNVTAGTAYQIAVDGYQGASGRVVLGFPGGTGYRVLNPSAGDTVPVIVRQPVGRVAAPGARVALSVAAASASKMTYQWSFQGAPIPGATSSSFVIPHLTASAVGIYDVLVVNNAGSAQSEPADVEMAVNQNIPVAATQNKFDTGAGASPRDIAYELRPRAGGDSRGFSVSQVFSTVGATTEAGEPNPCGQIVTAAKWFTYIAPGVGQLQISADGSDFNAVLGVYTGSGASFAALNEVACGYTTNYLTNGEPSVTLNVPAAGTRYYILLGGFNGDSGIAQLQIGSGQAPVFNSLPPSQFITAGAGATLRVTAGGSLPLSYQWQLNGANISGATKSTLNLPHTLESDEGNYTVVVSNSIGVITSSPPAALTLQFEPAIVSGPTNETVLLGQLARFSVKVAGVNVRTNPLVYQWYFNGAPIPRTDTATLSFRSHWTNQGTYSVSVSNNYGSVASAGATLTVVDHTAPAVVIHAPANNFATTSNQVTLTGTATDAAGIAFVQAQVNGGDVQYATGAAQWSVVLTGLAPGNNIIQVQSSDFAGNLSAPAKRTIIYRPSDNAIAPNAVTYSGLFYPTNDVSRDNAGFFSATVSPGAKRVFSAELLLAGQRYPVTGVLDNSGAAKTLISRAAATPLTLRLTLDSASNVLTGQVSSPGWVSSLRAETTSPSADAEADSTPSNGQFAIVLSSDSSLPVGYLNVAKTSGQNALISGSLDGSTLAQSANLSKSLPLYAPLYSGQGLLLGWINLNTATASEAFWIKPGAPPQRISIVK